ncbi:MAG: tetratricopeptide repeat protein, partial [Rhodobacterales bacterium]|nr:tetratricopeptide repeat protein [Rhodobacterales bacterium]
KGALDRLDRAAALARGPRHQGLLAEILSLRGNILFPMGELDACLEAHQRALELAGATGSPLAEARALGGMGDALYLRGRMITADGYYARCVDLARRHGWARIEAGNLAMRGLTGMYRLRLDQALAASEQAGRIAVAASDYRGELLSVNNLSTLHLAQDRPEAAKGLLERSLVLCRDMGSPRFELDCLSQMALALHGLGRAGQAWATAREALDQLDRTDDQFVGPTVLAFAARVAPDRETRRALLDRGLRLLDSNTISHNHLAFHEQAIEIAWRDGDGDAMDRCAKALDLHTRAEPLPWATLIADRGRALAAWGRGDRNDTLRRRLADLAARARQAGLVLDFPPTEDDEP